MGFYKVNKKLNLENEVEEVLIEEPATTEDTIEDVVEQDITTSEFQETSKDLEEAIETSDELESVGSEVQEELDAVNERLESKEPIDPVDVTVVNESIQHYSKLLGLTRESVNLSLEDVRNNTRESMEGLKVELEGIGEKIKEYAKKAWDKIIELIKKFIGFLFNIRKSIDIKIENILTGDLEMPDENFELTHKERTVLTFGFKYLIDSYTKAIQVLSQAAGKAGEKLLKMDIKTSPDESAAIGEKADADIRDMANKLKPEDNNPNINMRHLLSKVKVQFSREGEKLLALLPYAADDETGAIKAITVSITSNTGNTGRVESATAHFTNLGTAEEYSAFVDKVYRDKDYMIKEVSALKSLGDWNKSYLDNLFNLGTLIAKKQDEHMNQPGLEGINNQSPIYYGSLEHCKKVIKTVLALGRNYLSTVDCFVKYIDKHFVNHSDSKAATPA